MTSDEAGFHEPDVLHTLLKTLLNLSAHTCNPSYSGGRDQEDRGSKPALGT
jgi:hypothetical protein